MNYQVIARRFRPKKFSEVVGQEAIVTTLRNALKSGQLGSAYLFCGTRGTGKTTLARLLAKALNCQHLSEDAEPCNSCPSCVEIASGHSLNVLEIDGASNRGIDDIRQINETVGYAPSSGKYKIYLIDEVHMLTKEAFNALLKTLEEPPSHVKFFFATTEIHKVLPTILSRCQRFDLHPISLSIIKNKLREIVTALNAHIEEEALTLIAERSEGSLRDAQSFLDQLLCYGAKNVSLDHVMAAMGKVPRSLFAELDKAIYERRLAFAFELASQIEEAGYDTARFVEGFMEHISSILHVLLGGTAMEGIHRESALLYTQEQCLYILDYLIEWHPDMARSSFKRVGLEIILLHLLRTRYRLSTDVLIKRLLEEPERQPLPVPVSEIAPSDSPLPFQKKSKEIVEQKNESVTESVPAVSQAQLDTLMRFAAVELEATVKK